MGRCINRTSGDARRGENIRIPEWGCWRDDITFTTDHEVIMWRCVFWTSIPTFICRCVIEGFRWALATDIRDIIKWTLVWTDRDAGKAVPENPSEICITGLAETISLFRSLVGARVETVIVTVCLSSVVWTWFCVVSYTNIMLNVTNLFCSECGGRTVSSAGLTILLKKFECGARRNTFPRTSKWNIRRAFINAQLLRSICHEMTGRACWDAHINICVFQLSVTATFNANIFWCARNVRLATTVCFAFVTILVVEFVTRWTAIDITVQVRLLTLLSTYVELFAHIIAAVTIISALPVWYIGLHNNSVSICFTLINALSHSMWIRRFGKLFVTAFISAVLVLVLI